MKHGLNKKLLKVGGKVIIHSTEGTVMHIQPLNSRGMCYAEVDIEFENIKKTNPTWQRYEHYPLEKLLRTETTLYKLSCASDSNENYIISTTAPEKIIELAIIEKNKLKRKQGNTRSDIEILKELIIKDNNYGLVVMDCKEMKLFDF